MEPSKQESVSRQSSILKAPKQRQPLQIVATNPSSSESSPTIKIKRRVSFAKNKRIREFCNEVEPKEGLDDSYEEHDLSSTKSSSGNITDQPLVISVACEDKENFPIQLFIPTDQFECKEIQPAPSYVEGENLSQCEMEMENSINTSQSVNAEMQNKEMALSNATIFFDDGMDITASIQPQIISEHGEENDCYNDTVPVFQTYIEDVPVEMTENLQPILSKKLVHAQSTNHNVNFGNNSLNFTEPVSAILGIGHANKLLESQHTKPLARNCENETECFNDIPLEFTSVIPSSTWIRPYNQSQGNDETEKFYSKTMEFTEVAQHHNIKGNNKTEDTVNTSDKVMKTLLAHEDSKISNISLKQTQHNEVYRGKSNISCNNLTAINEVRSNQQIINQTGNVNYSLLEKMQEKTNIYPNASMEITEAVPVYNEIKTLPLNRREITEETPQEKIKLSIDASMKMTEMVVSQNKLDQHTGFKNKVIELDTNKTKVFFNTSMEMTEAVPNCQKINHPIEIISKSHPGNMQDKTKLFNDNSMEMTEALGFSKIQRLNQCKNQSMIPEKEKTQLFEIAGKNQPGNIPDKTKVFNDNSMEMTEALGFSHCKNQLMAPENEKTRLFEYSGKTHQGSIPDKTKVFNDNSMEMTEALGFSHCKNQLMAPKNDKTRLIEYSGKSQQGSIPNKTKVFNDNSMEMTEALGFNAIPRLNYCRNQSMVSEKEKTRFLEIAGKNQPGSIPEKTKIFNDNSMEMTEALGFNEIRKLNQGKNQLIASGNEKTQLVFNTSMEITEAVPVSNKINKSILTANKTHHEVMQDRTKLFNNKSMEVTEAVIHHNRLSPLSKFDNNQLSQPTQENTKLFFNTSMGMTVGAPGLLSKINQPTEDEQKTHEDITLQNTEYFCNKSMEITESVPAYHRVHQCTTGKGINQQEFMEDRTKIFQNKSMEVTETVLNYNKSDLLCNSKNHLAELGQERNKLLFNASMDMTEAAPVISRAHQIGSELKNTFCRNMPEQTEKFEDKSMEMTEAVKNSCSKNYHFEKCTKKSEINDRVQEETRVFPNMSITETIPVNKSIWQCNVENSTDTLKQSNNLNENLEIEAINSDNKTIGILRNDQTKYFNNKSMDFTEISPVLDHQNVSNYAQNEVPNLIMDKNKHFYSNAMDITETMMQNQSSSRANPSILTNSLKDSERLHQYDSILPNEINILNSNHLNNKKDNVFDRSSYRDKSFQRMTTDELHTLCASMNLPTQNYTTERSTTLQNDYISICNDVNVLRDSLQKNSIFQQNFTIGTGISIAMDNNMQVSTDVSGNSKKEENLQIFCNTNCDSIDRSRTIRKEELDILATEIESQKKYNTIDKHVLREENLGISEIKSMELDVRNSQDQNVFSISNKSHKNITTGNDTRYSNSNILNDKQTCGTQSNIHGLYKSEAFQIHNISGTFSNNQKSKRKSTEMDENVEITENSLKRLPSDNTDFLIATMGFRTELSHPLIINDRTTIKVPHAPLENNALALSFCSNETIRPEENISRGEHERYSKNVTTTNIENEVFDKECNLNKENKIPENKESLGKTKSFLENSMNKLDEIQPPSFLCSDSFQTDSIVDAEMSDNKSSDVIPGEIIQEQINVTSEKQYCTENRDSPNSQNSSTREPKQSSEKDFSPSISTYRVDIAKNFHKENSETVHKLVFFNNSKNFNESGISLINEEDVNTDPLAPFTELTKSIEMYEKRDDCIWTIRKIDQKTVAVDFISKSFVTVVRLNEIEKACIKDIDNIEFISRLHCDSKNTLLKIVHRLLLSKLKPDKLLSEYKMYEDVLPLLDFISNEVILAMNFMFDLERLSSLNLLSVESERVLFMVSSKKANIIVEISLILKVFNEIGPDDINVTCVLGDVRINDIKQLIVNIKKDSTFLSRYINDVKDYIMLMEESTHGQR